MRRRFIGILSVGLLLVAGFTAAAVAGGGSPLQLLDDQPRTARESTSVEANRDADEANRDEAKTGATTSRVAHKVTVCHHTGSQKHPFHAITVDEHALTAHTSHGDTVGACPSTTSSIPPRAKHAKQKHDRGRAHGANRSPRSEQGRGKHKSEHRRGAKRQRAE